MSDEAETSQTPAPRRCWLERMSRRFQAHLRRQLHRYAVLALVACVGFMGVTKFGEWGARQLEFNTVRLPAEALPGAGPLRIALLADVHNDDELMEACVEKVEAEKPDLIIFGGDLSTAGERFKRTRWATEAFRRLVAVAPVYAILGNHDYEKQEQVERVLATAGVRLLRNEAVDWKTPSGSTLRIVGLGDWNEGDEAPQFCMKAVGKEDDPVLLLSHDPESRHLLRGYEWQLMLSGHTHGGQIGNPFTGSYISFRSDMPAGLFDDEGGRRVFVTRGVGAIWGMRFFCPPEMNFIEIAGEARK